jgi:hypothetical protein
MTAALGHRHRLLLVVAVGLLAALTPTGGATAAPDPEPLEAPRAAPSDPRATYFDGNATTCDEVGYPAADRVGAQGAASARDPYVIGQVTRRDPDTLQVDILPAGDAAGVVVDAVVVKGSNGYNVYEDPFTPPTATSPQNYISPRTSVGFAIADISHWYVCYRRIDPEPGSLVVTKRALPVSGTPAEPLPTSFTVDVICTLNDAVVAEDSFVFESGGGTGRTADEELVLPDLPVGTVCVVTEQGTDGFPPGTSVGYVPAEAATTGVAMTEGSGVVVVVENDFSGVEVLTGSLQVLKQVEGGSGADLPDILTVEIACTDGTRALVTVPGDGGVGTPTVDGIRSGAYCSVREDPGAVGDGWQVSYVLPDGTTTEQPAAVAGIEGDATVSVTVVNVVPAAVATTTTTTPTTTPSSTTVPPPTTEPASSTTAPTQTTTTAPFVLPATGRGSGLLVPAVLVATLGGISLLLARRRTGSSPPS